MGKKMTKDEYVDLIHQTFPNVEMIGDYINSTTDTHFKCSIDKHKWITTPIKARQYGCPVCSGYIVTKEKYEQELYEIHGDNIILTGDFKGKTFKTKHHSNKHNFDFFPYPYALLRGQGCKYCAKEKLKKHFTIPQEDAGKYINVSGSAIQKCCIGQSKSSGIDKETNTPLHWCYYDNYIQENEKSTLSLYGGEGTLFM